jgi:hypothetical protein
MYETKVVAYVVFYSNLFLQWVVCGSRPAICILCFSSYGSRPAICILCFSCYGSRPAILSGSVVKQWFAWWFYITHIFLHFVKSFKSCNCYTDSCFIFIYTYFSDSGVERQSYCPNLRRGSQRLRNSGIVKGAALTWHQPQPTVWGLKFVWISSYVR